MLVFNMTREYQEGGGQSLLAFRLCNLPLTQIQSRIWLHTKLDIKLAKAFLSATRSQNYYCNLIIKMTVKQSQIHAPGWGGCSLYKTDISNTASEHKPRIADMFVWNCEGCSPVREQVFFTDPPKPDPSLQYHILRVNFYTVTWSRSLRSGKVLWTTEYVLAWEYSFHFIL